MLKSMTGFGRGESQNEDYCFSIEIKTVNHRYNDIVMRMPKYLNYLEEKVKSIIKNKINRGRVEVYVELEYLNDSNLDINIDMPLAKSYKAQLDNMMEELNITDEVKLLHMLMFPDIIRKEKREIEEDLLWESLEKALETALDHVVAMRVKEGIILKEDMERQIDKIKEELLKIENRSPMVIVEYRDKLENRISELINKDMKIDEDRLNYEIAFFADRADINEEVVRLKSHCNQFSNSLNETEPVGRRLDFLLQEMNREINTIGSKSDDIIISNCVVNIKSQLEKIREQVQNVE